MLNLSKINISDKVDQSQYESFSKLKVYKIGKIFAYMMIMSITLLIVGLFLPWTQNIRSTGYLTTLTPDQRPQTINSIIDGRIEKWFVREGDLVDKGDTILFISEVKDEYFDPNLMSRTEDQIKSKELSVDSYAQKIKALDAQIAALQKTRQLKIKQAKNYLKQAELKIISDSLDLIAADNNYKVALSQYERMEKLYDQGLKSLTDFENRRVKMQEARAKLIGQENKLLTSRNEYINAEVELSSIDNQYRDKLSKAQSDKFTAMSSMYDAEVMVTKMQNQYMNYSMRQDLYYITAPQSGYITRAIRSGIGETIKAGEKILDIMPSKYDLAVSMYVEPVDLPLVKIDQKVRFLFDGWPTIVFSGWPGISYGSFGGRVVAIDNFISANGKYRILVAPDPNDEPWPDGLRVGSGARGIALLNEVRVWYEIWRQLNGFPPDYYGDEVKKEEGKKEKKDK